MKELDEPFKSIAYEVILKDLIEDTRRKPFTPSAIEEQKTPSEETEDPVEKFMSSRVDPGEYANLFAAKGQLLEKSLAVLKLARDTLGIDGLTAPQITDILIRKFRVSKVHRPNVSTALKGATTYVHRIKAHGDYKYLLMIRSHNPLPFRN